MSAAGEIRPQGGRYRALVEAGVWQQNQAICRESHPGANGSGATGPALPPEPLLTAGSPPELPTAPRASTSRFKHPVRNTSSPF